MYSPEQQDMWEERTKRKYWIGESNFFVSKACPPAIIFEYKGVDESLTNNKSEHPTVEMNIFISRRSEPGVFRSH
jgi:hypothetical protein